MNKLGLTAYYNKRCELINRILRCYSDIYVNSFCPRTATLWNYLPTEYFPLTYNLNGINRDLLSVVSF